MNLIDWALKWGVPPQALDELQALDEQRVVDDRVITEAGVQSRVKLEAAQAGGVLWRNNCGAMRNEYGQTVRFGLGNDSTKINKHFKSSDLIGIMPVTITQQMVGTVIGKFVAVECKTPGWEFRGTDREQAQLNFINVVRAHGGEGRFASK